MGCRCGLDHYGYRDVRGLRGHQLSQLAHYGDVSAELLSLLPGSVKSEIDSLKAQLAQAKSEASALAVNAGGLLNMKDPGALVEWIMIESEYTPTIRVLGPLAVDNEPPSSGAKILSFIKPKVSIKFQQIDKPIVIAPYGQPGPSHWPALTLSAGLVGGGLLGYFFAGKKGAIGGALLGAGVLGSFR